MDPVFDSEHNLIVGGDRVKLSDFSYEAKLPIILPNKDLLLEKLISNSHTLKLNMLHKILPLPCYINVFIFCIFVK